MRTARVQLLSALLLLGACVAVALLSAPAVLGAAASGLRAQREITNEVGSAAAAALDGGTPSDLRMSIGSLIERHPELQGVEIVTTDGRAPLTFGAVDRLHGKGSSAPRVTDSVTLVRGGRPWGVVNVEFKPAARGAFRTGLPWYLIVLVVVVLPITVAGVELLRRRLDRSPEGPMAAAAERARHTLDTLAEGILLMDGEARIVFANHAFCEMAGASPSALQGAPADRLPWAAPGQDAGPDLRPWEPVITTGEAARGVRTALRRADSTAVFIVNCTPLFRKPGLLHGVLVSFDDVTELEASRAATQAARDAAQHANQAKSSFLAMMSHEIRTPLNGVCGTLQLLKRTPLQKSQSQYIEAATFSASTLLHLINDVLDLSKIEAGQLELSPVEFDLDECVDRTMLMMVQTARAKSLTLAYHIEPGVSRRFNADPDRIRQIIINLTNNAIKFTERGSVSLRVGVENDSPARQLLRCAVTDTGIGIPTDKLPRLFKAFSQVDSSTSRRYGGTGLGLVISKQLCEAMGGRIDVASTPGEGTTFTFLLDLEKATGAPPAQPAPEHRPARALLVGLHELEVRQIRDALDLTEDRVLAASSVDSLAQTLRSGSVSLARDDSVLLIAGNDNDAAASIPRLRELVRNQTTRLLLAVWGQDSSPPPSAGPGCRVILRPLGRGRLMRALEQDDGAKTPGAAPAPGAPDISGVRVLLAEDNQVGQMVVSDMLRSAGAHCDVAGDGNQVLAALKDQPYDIVLMDCFMPELDGFGATRRIRDLQREGALPPHMPVIALTAKAMRGDKEACMEAGMDGYITKPVDQDELIRVVAQHAADRGHSAAPAPPGPAPTTSGLDASALEERYRGKPALLRKLAEAFKDTSAQDLERIHQAIGTGNAGALEHAAHRLAGGAGFVSADGVRRLAADLEHRAAEHQLEGLGAIADQLKREVRDAVAGLDRLVGPAPESMTAGQGKERAS